MGVDVEKFTELWVRAWNAHDVDAVLDHFDDEVVFTSPVAARFLPATRGRVNGKRALREYWLTAMGEYPDLHFFVEAVYSGVDTIVINYRNQLGGLVNEVLRFADGLIVEGHGTYFVGPHVESNIAH